MKKLLASCLIFLCLLSLCGCVETDYEKAGKNFDTWINEDPDTWSDAEKQYFDDFMDWADKQ